MRLSYQEQERQKKLEYETVKFAAALDNDMLPKMEKAWVQEEHEAKDGKIELVKRPATLEEKRKILFVIARRRAKLFAQQDEMKAKREIAIKRQLESINSRKL